MRMSQRGFEIWFEILRDNAWDRAWPGKDCTIWQLDYEY